MLRARHAERMSGVKGAESRLTMQECQMCVLLSPGPSDALVFIYAESCRVGHRHNKQTAHSVKRLGLMYRCTF